MRDRRSFRRGQRGLAEIVGTLMLVLIVVAAATAFSFFVASSEQTNLAEKNQLQLKNLENVTIQSVMNNPPQPSGCIPSACTFPGSLILILSSSDIYNTSITDIAVGGDPVTSFCDVPLGCSIAPPTPNPNFELFAAAPGGAAYLTLVPFSVTAVTLNYSSFYLPFSYSVSSLQVQMGTTRGNEFVESLFPPIAEIGVDFVSGYPVLDGSQSYQPHAGSSPSATIVQWVWTVTSSAGSGDPDQGTFYGQEAQLPAEFTPGVTYTIGLTVTNTIGLTGTGTESYSVP
jgi:flagellin-like protein